MVSIEEKAVRLSEKEEQYKMNICVAFTNMC